MVVVIDVSSTDRRGAPSASKLELESQAGRFAVELARRVSARRLRPQLRRRPVSLVRARGRRWPLFEALAQLSALHVDAFEHSFAVTDLCFEFGSSVAVPPAQLRELTLGRRNTPCRLLALPVELSSLLGEQPADRVGPFSTLIDGEWLGGGTLEGVGGAFGRSGRVGLAERRLAVEDISVGQVETGLQTGAAASDIAPLL